MSPEPLRPSRVAGALFALGAVAVSAGLAGSPAHAAGQAPSRDRSAGRLPAVRGQVWQDGNGVREAQAGPVAGVRVHLWSERGMSADAHGGGDVLVLVDGFGTLTGRRAALRFNTATRTGDPEALPIALPGAARPQADVGRELSSVNASAARRPTTLPDRNSATAHPGRPLLSLSAWFEPSTEDGTVLVHWTLTGREVRTGGVSTHHLSGDDGAIRGAFYHAFGDPTVASPAAL